MTKPVLLITQRLTQAVEARAAREFDARLGTGDAPVGGEALAGWREVPTRSCAAVSTGWTARPSARCPRA